MLSQDVLEDKILIIKAALSQKEALTILIDNNFHLYNKFNQL